MYDIVCITHNMYVFRMRRLLFYLPYWQRVLEQPVSNNAFQDGRNQGGLASPRSFLYKISSNFEVGMLRSPKV